MVVFPLLKESRSQVALPEPHFAFSGSPGYRLCVGISTQNFLHVFLKHRVRSAKGHPFVLKNSRGNFFGVEDSGKFFAAVQKKKKKENCF